MKITHACIITDDVVRLRTFYQEVLQLEPSVGKTGKTYVEFPVEGCILSLFSLAGQENLASGSMQPASNRSMMLEFQVTDVDKEYERLKQLNVEWVKLPTTQPWGNRSIYFRDPDGNLINFYMRKIAPQRFQDAKAFIMNNGRELEQQLFEYCFEGGTVESILAALSHYQNADGGFGRALEPDIRMEGSSVIATTVGLQVLREIRASGDHPMVQRAIRYLLATYDPDREVWPIVPKGVDDAPHAPWWNHDQTAETFNGFLANPRAEIVGYFYDYSEFVPAGLLAKLTAVVLAHLETLPDQMDMHDLLCYIRLAETERLSGPERDRVWKRLTQAALHTVTRDPERWKSYSVKPLWLAPSPSSPLFEVLKKDVEANLDFEIDHQNEDGAWSPFWSWEKLHPEAWREAEREWKGHLTLRTLKSLRDFGRVEDIS